MELIKSILKKKLTYNDYMEIENLLDELEFDIDNTEMITVKQIFSPIEQTSNEFDFKWKNTYDE